ncbi:hypothetical protein MSG28_012305 [Choristoneura fumiferana]|uniref:Uncharacterized protein n=1 Tax=Choristoneura fumiferana TaxID=7141 RepID=A0ACC0KCL2_CHOFU|nr:hypothetical protein MSG28_012305 [Choristoneura fumiferana]
MAQMGQALAVTRRNLPVHSQGSFWRPPGPTNQNQSSSLTRNQPGALLTQRQTLLFVRSHRRTLSHRIVALIRNRKDDDTSRSRNCYGECRNAIEWSRGIVAALESGGCAAATGARYHEARFTYVK